MRRLLDTEAAAVAVGGSVRHVRNLVSRGLLVNHGDSRNLRLDLDEINDAIDKGRIPLGRKAR